MIFTSLDYVVFSALVFGVYWVLPNYRFQNIFLLAASFFFYGYVHPYLCLLLAGAVVVNYGAALSFQKYSHHRKNIAAGAVGLTLVQLGIFKYFDFFADNIAALASAVGFSINRPTLEVLLPVGISFYSFQALSYTIDVYRGKMAPRRNLVDVALFVSFFPQLVAGPIERANRLLPQIEEKRRVSSDTLISALPLLITGVFKKMVIADSISVYVDKVFGLAHPPLALLLAGSVAFSIQIYADFSAYTDIARGSARLLGFELIENFNAPYLAVSPSDFWRRWHISFSTWIRDYLYVPLGGSRNIGWPKQLWVLLMTFGLSGLWHGAAWHFVFWGFYHAALLFLYRMLGIGAHFKPTHLFSRLAAVIIMGGFTVVGWMLFRASSMEWLVRALTENVSFGLSGRALIATQYILLWAAFFGGLLGLSRYQKRWPAEVRGAVLGIWVMFILVFARDSGQDFIYFQF